MNYTIRLDANIPASEVIDKSKAFFPSSRSKLYHSYLWTARSRPRSSGSISGMEQLLIPRDGFRNQSWTTNAARCCRNSTSNREQEILDVRCISSEAYASIGILKNKPKPILVYRRDYYRPNWSPTLSQWSTCLDCNAIMTEQVAGIYWVGTTKPPEVVAWQKPACD